MASTILYKGRALATPQSITDVDASALTPQNLAATGVVALIGEAEGGRPVSAITDVTTEAIVIGSPSALRAVFRSGDLREAGDMAFNPSQDAIVGGGAAQVVAMKVNPATRATGVLVNDVDDPVIDLTSDDYGEYTNQINVLVQSGATAGKLLNARLEGTTEIQDDIGATGVLSLHYDDGGEVDTWDTARASVDQAGNLSVLVSRVLADTSTDVVDPTAADIIQIAASVPNAGKRVRVYGALSGTFQSEVLTISASDPVSTAATYDVFYGALLLDGAVPETADIVLTAPDAPDTLGTLAFSTSDRAVGGYGSTAMFVDGAGVDRGYASVMLAAGTGPVVLEGLSPSGVPQREVLNASTARALSSLPYGEILGVITGAAGDDVTVYAHIVDSVAATDNTIAKLVGRADLKSTSIGGVPVGVESASLTGATQRPPSILDEVYDFDVYSSAPAVLRGVTQACLDFFSSASALIDGTLSARSPATWTVQVAATPIATSTPVALTIGGVVVQVLAAGAAPTQNSVRAQLIEAINRHPGVRLLVTATAAASDGLITLTARHGRLSNLSLAVSDSDANLVTTQTAVGVGARTPPADLAQPLFLSGAIDGVTTFADWERAFDLLRELQVNTVVPLTALPSVHALASAHCEYMCTFGKLERDGFVGMEELVAGVPTGAPPSKVSWKAQIVDINSRHIRAAGQTIERFNSAGVRQVFPTYFQAVIGAGMQASAAVGEPLTFKFANVLKVSQSLTWSPIQDSDEMLQAGCWFMENVPGVGRRIVRDITTYLVSDNLAFGEASVNRVVNQVTFELRQSAEPFLGRPGTPRILEDLRSALSAKLNTLLSASTIVAWRSLTLSRSLDVVTVAVEAAPVLPINFIPIRVNLVDVPQSA